MLFLVGNLGFLSPSLTIPAGRKPARMKPNWTLQQKNWSHLMLVDFFIQPEHYTDCSQAQEKCSPSSVHPGPKNIFKQV
jgi:hypothetical protein